MSPTRSSPAPQAPRGARATREVRPSCEGCYFGRRMLCALDRDEPCSTFRADSPDGLVPPAQPALLVRTGDREPATAELPAAA